MRSTGGGGGALAVHEAQGCRARCVVESVARWLEDLDLGHVPFDVDRQAQPYAPFDSFTQRFFRIHRFGALNQDGRKELVSDGRNLALGARRSGRRPNARK